MKVAIYPLSADPITFGHLDIIKRALKIFDRLIVAIGQNQNKKYLFSLQKRTEIAKEVLKSYKNLEVISFEGLLTDLVLQKNIYCIVRGVRNSKDYLSEVDLYQNYLSQNLDLEFINLFSNQHFISSSSVKEIFSLQGDVSKYVPTLVKKELQNEILEQNIVAITGTIGSGKSFVGKQFLSFNQNPQKEIPILESQKKIKNLKLLNQTFFKKATTLNQIFDQAILELKQKLKNPPIHFFDLDKIGHFILKNLDSNLKVLEQLKETFGKEIFLEKSIINKNKLAEIVFKNPKKLTILNSILHPQILYLFRLQIKNLKGLILIEVPLLAEESLEYLSNNQIIFVKNDITNQKNRLLERGWGNEKITERLQNQLSEERKIEEIVKQFEVDNFGSIWLV